MTNYDYFSYYFRCYNHYLDYHYYHYQVHYSSIFSRDDFVIVRDFYEHYYTKKLKKYCSLLSFLPRSICGLVLIKAPTVRDQCWTADTCAVACTKRLNPYEINQWMNQKLDSIKQQMKVQVLGWFFLFTPINNVIIWERYILTPPRLPSYGQLFGCINSDSTNTIPHAPPLPTSLQLGFRPINPLRHKLVSSINSYGCLPTTSRIIVSQINKFNSM